VLAAPDGMPINWCLATPKLGERDVARALLGDCQRPAELPGWPPKLQDAQLQRLYTLIVGNDPASWGSGSPCGPAPWWSS